MATLQTRLGELITSLGTDWKNIWAKIGAGSLNTTAQNLIDAINEVKTTADSALGGGASQLNELSDVTITTPSTGHILRHNGSLFVNALGTTYFDAAGSAAAAQAASQPLDSDLTSIAALSTTAYGRGFLTLADQAATMALLAAGTTTSAGILELATDGETTTGTDTARAITPANLAASWAARIATSTSLGTSDVLVPSQNAVKSYADSLIGAANGMVFKGVIDASTNPNYPAADAGDVYRISVAGKIGGASGPNVEVGDLILCLTDSTSSGTQAAVGTNWNISQVNIDGAVTGPASAVSANLSSFNGTTGKIIQDSGFAPSNSAIGGGSATILPTSSAVVAYAQPLDSDLTSIAALSTTAYGRGLLTLADAAALTAALSAASETVSGRIEIATQTETNTGTDDVRAVTPLKLATNISALFGNPDTDLVALYTTAKA